MYRLRLLGGLALEGPSGPLSGRIVQQRRLAVLALLAISRDTGLSRDKLVGYLWPESDEERARHRLANTLHEFRKALGEEVVQASGEMLRLNAEVVWADVRELEAALEHGEPAAAVELYGGPFLDGVHLGEALEFERWVEGERERYAGLYARALEALAREAEDQGDYGKAADWWKRLAAQDPYDSRLVVRVMEALAAAGDVANALQHARAHELLLKQELEVELPAEVQETIERLRTQPVAAGAPPAKPSEPAVEEAPTVALADESRRPPGWRKVALGAVGVVVLGGVLVGGWLAFGRGEPPEPEPVMVVVLPFENLGTADDEYLADGITDALNGALTAVREIGVTSRTSAYAVRAREMTAREIGTELGVQYILEGTVLRERPGDQTSRVRIIPQLIRVADDTHLWAETYDVEMAEVFNVYLDIARSVASALEVTLLEQERLALLERPTDNFEAYDYYLRAEDRHQTGADRNIEIRLLERAVELDPDFAIAYARLAMSYLSLHRTAQYARTDFSSDDRRESLAAAKAALERALEIDPEEPVVRLAAGRYYYLGEVDLDRALEEFKAAERLGGLRDPVYYWLGVTHRKRGELDGAIRYMTRHVQYNPLSNGGWRELAVTYMMLHRFAEAERCFDRAIALNPSVAVDYQWKGWLYLIWNGDKERARRAIDEQAIVLGLHAPTGGVDILGRARYRILREYYEQDVLEGEGYDPMLKGLAFELAGDLERSRAYYDSARAIREPRVAEFPEDFTTHFILAFVYAELGRDAEAIREAEAALRLSEGVFLNRDHVVANAAEVFLLVGEHERALELIEVALSNPGSYITPMELRLDPVWDPIREHPRFQALLEEYE